MNPSWPSWPDGAAHPETLHRPIGVQHLHHRGSSCGDSPSGADRFAPPIDFSL